MKKTLIWAFLSTPIFTYSQVNTTPRIKLSAPPVENKEREYRQKGVPMETEQRFPLIIANGTEYQAVSLNDFDIRLKKISADTTQSIRLLKGKEALDKYGEKGAAGVLEVTKR